MRLKRMHLIVAAATTLTPLSLLADKKPELVKPMAGPRATSVRVAWLYITPSKDAQKVSKVEIGRELVIAEKSTDWLRVYANTDIEEEHSNDQPTFGEDAPPPPVSGWIENRGVVVEDTPDGDRVLMGTAANEETLASDPRGPVNAAHAAHLLYRRLVELFPNSPLAPEAAWRAADILWQLARNEQASLPSSHQRDAYLRDEIDEDPLRKVIKLYPHTRQSDLAEFDLIDNKLCGDWQGSEQCPEQEVEVYEKYADQHPDGPRTAQALYNATYREAALVDMYSVDGKNDKAADAHRRAADLASRLSAKFPQSDYAVRAAALVFKLDQGVAVYGNDHD